MEKRKSSDTAKLSSGLGESYRASDMGAAYKRALPESLRCSPSSKSLNNVGDTIRKAADRRSVGSIVAMPEIQHDEIKDAYTFAIQLAKDAGQILLKGLDERRTTGLNSDVHVDEVAHVEKANAVDIVTQTDNGMHGHRVRDIVTDNRRR